MHKTILFIVAMSVSLSACSNGSGKADKKEDVSSYSLSSSQSKSLAEVLKGKTLTGYESQTIGKAFDGYRYFSGTEWKETRGEKGKIYVDFNGWFDKKITDSFDGKDGVSAKGLNVKFVIYDNGSYAVVMVSKFGTTASGATGIYPQQNISEMLACIYGNKQLPF